MLQDRASPDTLISAYQPSPLAPFQHVTNKDILCAVHTAIPHNPNEVKGYSADLVGLHSLWEGGAMALFQQGCKIAKTMKIGCWTSTTFMSYIYNNLMPSAKAPYFRCHRQPPSSTWISLHHPK